LVVHDDGARRRRGIGIGGEPARATVHGTLLPLELGAAAGAIPPAREEWALCHTIEHMSTDAPEIDPDEASERDGE
jgi:hypothetical protein